LMVGLVEVANEGSEWNWELARVRDLRSRLCGRGGFESLAKRHLAGARLMICWWWGLSE
jgi:hypothetical protein